MKQIDKKGVYDRILDSLLKYFHKHWVYPTELGDYLGMDYRTIKSKFDMTRNGMSVEELAIRMCTKYENREEVGL